MFVTKRLTLPRERRTVISGTILNYTYFSPRKLRGTIFLSRPLLVSPGKKEVVGQGVECSPALHSGGKGLVGDVTPDPRPLHNHSNHQRAAVIVTLVSGVMSGMGSAGKQKGN